MVSHLENTFTSFVFFYFEISELKINRFFFIYTQMTKTGYFKDWVDGSSPFGDDPMDLSRWKLNQTQKKWLGAQAAKGVMSVGQLAKRFNLKPQAIAYYNQISKTGKAFRKSYIRCIFGTLTLIHLL